MPDPTPYLVPGLAGFYAALAPFAEALLRAVTGLALVPHGLRMTFGFFPDSGLKVRILAMLARQLDETGYRPGRLWAPAIAFTELVCGPLLALGLFTPADGGGGLHLPCRVQCRALARRRLFLEQAGARIHAALGGGGLLFSGPRRRRLLARSRPRRTRVLNPRRRASRRKNRTETSMSRSQRAGGDVHGQGEQRRVEDEGNHAVGRDRPADRARRDRHVGDL